jgi:hypothetical protein
LGEKSAGRTFPDQHGERIADRNLKFRRPSSCLEPHSEAFFWLAPKGGDHPVVDVDDIEKNFSLHLPLLDDITC